MEHDLRWSIYYKIVLINGLVVPLVSALLLVPGGFFLAGKTGLINRLTWGITIGVFTAPLSGYIV